MYNYREVWQTLKKLYNAGMLTKKKATLTMEAHQQLPSSSTIRKKFGGLHDMLDYLEEGKTFEEVYQSEENYYRFCEDCICDRETCGMEAKECKEEADIYNELYDLNNVSYYIHGKGKG